jgi:glycosyltransferase involved in cell wall biosynthesis
LANEIGKSFLSEYNTVVINNGVDTAIFQPSKSLFRQRFEIEDKIILLGVAFDWGKRKGLQYFEMLERDLDDRYQIVLVGVNESQAKRLSDRFILIPSTQNQKELAEIYSAADVFVNPTLEDNFPTVNIEALACGTPVITFQTGGSPEAIDSSCGWVVPYGDYEAMKGVIEGLDRKTEEIERNCVEKGKQYKKEDKFLEYIELFDTLVGEKNEF